MQITIDDIRNQKIDAEDKIRIILLELMETTRCRVTKVEITTEEGFGSNATYVTNVEIILEV